MRYVHTEDEPVRAAADAVALRRQALVSCVAPSPAREPAPELIVGSASISSNVPEAPRPVSAEKPIQFEDSDNATRAKLGNYRPFRHRNGASRPVPPGTKRAGGSVKDAANGR